AEPEPEPQPEPEPAPAAAQATPAPMTPAAAGGDLYAAYLAAAADVMKARAGAGTSDGDAKLAEAVEARDAAKAAWEGSRG
ncbi:MAG: hypothetical protein M3401_10775, partial [Actinomycetota bacterium]|nr:hypothetical protein [Actinomycetota bacterium]